MEAEALPAKRRPSLSNARSLSGSLQDDMMPAVPAMMMMPSFVYYHVVSPFHSPFRRMGESMWSNFAFDSSEEEEEEAEESKKILDITKIANDQASGAEEKESDAGSQKEEEENEVETENEEVTEAATAESIDGSEGEVTTEFPADTESTNPQTTEEDNSVTETTATTQLQQTDDKAGAGEDQLSTKPDDSRSVRTSGRSSVTYVCKYGKCRHSMEAKKLLEQEIEAELWAKT